MRPVASPGVTHRSQSARFSACSWIASKQCYMSKPAALKDSGTPTPRWSRMRDQRVRGAAADQHTQPRPQACAQRLQTNPLLVHMASRTNFSSLLCILRWRLRVRHRRHKPNVTASWRRQARKHTPRQHTRVSSHLGQTAAPRRHRHKYIGTHGACTDDTQNDQPSPATNSMPGQRPGQTKQSTGLQLTHCMHAAKAVKPMHAARTV